MAVIGKKICDRPLSYPSQSFGLHRKKLKIVSTLQTWLPSIMIYLANLSNWKSEKD